MPLRDHLRDHLANVISSSTIKYYTESCLWCFCYFSAIFMFACNIFCHGAKLNLLVLPLQVSVGLYHLFYPSDRYLWMKVVGWISRSRPPLALSAMFSPTPLPWFVYSNLLQNVSRPFINPTRLTWHGYFMHVVRADIRTSHTSYVTP